MISIQKIRGWGNFPVTKASVLHPSSVEELLQMVAEYPSLLARGNGRSYGDSSLHDTVIDMRGLNRILSETSDTIEVEAGVTLEQILQHIVPKKRFLAVTPGIKSITIGGAVASDVHGKNHLHEGSFYNITDALQIIDEQGRLIQCSRTENASMFYNAFGSMGLQCIIVSATIQLVEIESVWIKEQQVHVKSLEDLFEKMDNHIQSPYLVAWLNLMERETEGIVKLGRWAAANEVLDGRSLFQLPKNSLLSVPFRFPIAMPAFLFRWYNRFYLAKAKKNPDHLIHYDQYFYPLDAIKNWNHVYGPNGMLQYHFALPLNESKIGLKKAIDLIQQSKATCTLAVIKRFGKPNAETPQSFPIEGLNLALDFINIKQAQLLIKQLDTLVASLNGRIYKTKDALSSLPSAEKNGKFQSLQNKRYGTKNDQ